MVEKRLMGKSMKLHRFEMLIRTPDASAIRTYLFWELS